MQTAHLTTDPWQGLMAVKEIVLTTKVSRAHWHSLVKAGKAPPPVIRIGTRYTRWRASDVQSWLANPQAWIDANVAQFPSPQAEQRIVGGVL